MPVEAARIYLETLRTRYGFAAVAIADADGLLVAGSSADVDTEAVAAIAPLAGGGGEPPDGLLGLITRGRPLQVAPIRLGDVACYLACVGDGAPTLPPADEALNRILAA